MKKIFLLLFLSFQAHSASYFTGSTSIRSSAIVTVSSTGTLLLSGNINRTYMILINQCASTNLYVKADAIPSTTEGITIPGLGNWEPYVVPRNAVYAKTATGTCDVSVTYGE